MREACRADAQDIAHFAHLAAGCRILQYKEGRPDVIVDGRYMLYGAVTRGVVLAQRASKLELIRESCGI